MRNTNHKTVESQFFKGEWEIMQYQQIKQKEIIKAVEAARKNERAKIAHEIQENLNQVLVAALLYLELAKTDEESREMCLEKSSSFISIVIKELAVMYQALLITDKDWKPADS